MSYTILKKLLTHCAQPSPQAIILQLNCPLLTLERITPRQTLNSYLIVLKWEKYVVYLLPIARLLNIANMTAPAVRNAGCGDLIVGDSILTCDVFGAHKTRNCQLSHLEIHPDLLRAFNAQNSVGQHVRLGGSAPQRQLFVSRNPALAGARA